MFLLSHLIIGDSIKLGFIGIGIYIDSGIYTLACHAYKIFMALAAARFFTNSMYKDIANSIYFIIGVAMLFVLAYAIVKGVIDPDKMSKEKMGGPKMVGNVLTCVLGLALTPVIFNLLYQAQGIIIDNQVIENIIFRDYETNSIDYSYQKTDGSTVTGTEEYKTSEYYKKIGGSFTTAQVWESMFRPADDIIEDSDGDGVIDEDEFYAAADSDSCKGDPSEYYTDLGNGWTLASIGFLAVGAVAAVVGAATSWTGAGAVIAVAGVGMVGSAIAANSNYSEAAKWDGEEMTLMEAYEYASAYGDFGIFQIFATNIAEDGTISYSFFVTLICGLFLCYAFVSFSIDMGTRAAKLAYYQIIAPVPLIMKIIPNYEKNFREYVRSVISTFLEVLVRILVIYITVYLICHISELFSSMSFADDLNFIDSNFARAFLIIGLILFAKKAPELITSSLGIKPGDLHFGIREKLARGEVFTAGAALGSMATAGTRNFRNKWSENQGAGFAKRLGKSTLSAAGGVGGAGVRSVRDRYKAGKDGYLKDARAMRDTAGRVANETTDARDARTEWYNSHNDGGKRGKVETFVRGHVEDVDKSIRAWSTGTIKTDKEDRDLTFARSLDSLKGDLRNEAYKKNARAQSLKAQHDALAAETVSEWKAGWNETAMSDEIERRLANDTQYTTLRAAHMQERAKADAANAALAKAESDLNQAKAAGVTGAQLAALESTKSAAEAKQKKVNESLEAAGRTLGARRDEITQDVKSIAQRNSAEMAKAMSEHQSQVDGYRVAMEAAADAWVKSEAGANKDNNIKNMMNEFLQKNAKSISSYSSDVLIEGKDGKDSVTIGSLISDTFGSGALHGGSVNGEYFAGKKDRYEYTYKGADKKDHTIVYEYDSNTDSYVSNNSEVEQKDRVFKSDDFFAQFLVREGKAGREYKSKTDISVGTGTAGDAIKEVSRKKTEKVQLQRETEKKK